MIIEQQRTKSLQQCFEGDPLLCPCSGRMRIAGLTAPPATGAAEALAAIV